MSDVNGETLLIKITGIVQGVGFRPFVYKLATSLDLHGWVNNTGSTVSIHVEGTEEHILEFTKRLHAEAPPLSDIQSMKIQQTEFHAFESFQIRESSGSRDATVYIPYDVSICPDCIGELFDPSNRRYLYPFINCTNCGPRFTIIDDIPYDRKNTTMKIFPMCLECAKEYTDPKNRRYHAQPVSCPHCGPELKLLDGEGKTIEVFTQREFPAMEKGTSRTQGIKGIPHTQELMETVRSLLHRGNIIAVKGLGGYHLTCNALNPGAVKRLRKRKVRDDKPFAVMMKDADQVMKYCYLSDDEKKLLESDKKPIVLLRKREGCTLPQDIAPGNKYLGVMLPYTPLHMLLFAGEVHIHSVLVMTSGNRSSEPIYYQDEKAVKELAGIADYFLVHNREIHKRVDDSVTRILAGGEYISRRSRGYVPAPVMWECGSGENIETAKGSMETSNGEDGNIETGTVKDSNMEVGTIEDGSTETSTREDVSTAPSPLSTGLQAHIQEKKDLLPVVLAVGGELKNTFCINRDREFFISHHIGDLENTETLKSFEEGIEHFTRIFKLTPSAIAYDLHPRYLSTQYALARKEVVKVAVQHHHAHIASCMLENELEGDVVGVAFDGTGYGEDGHIWGGEFFAGGYGGFKRVGHLEYVPMPGGEAAIKQPWRMAMGYLHVLENRYGAAVQEASERLLKAANAALEGTSEAHQAGIAHTHMILNTMMEKGINSPLTSSMGRLFDAVAALAGIRYEISYEGQAAIELEYAYDKACPGSYPLDFTEQDGVFTVRTESILQGVLDDVRAGAGAPAISARFHHTAADLVLEGCRRIRRSTGLDRVVLSGGVFQNVTLMELALDMLGREGFRVYIHRKVPTNDAGICLGQSAMAVYQMKR